MQRFGGDPEKITIAGQSAGCICGQTIVSSPLSKGKVRGAILQSGGGIGGICAITDKEKMWEISGNLMAKIGISTVEQLRLVPASQLCAAAFQTSEKELPWTQNIDGWLVCESTDVATEKGHVLDIAYMIGSTGDDLGGKMLLQERGARFCENQLRLGRMPAYFYLFDRKLPGDDVGAFHSRELWYEFETLGRCWRPWEKCDWALSHTMNTYWANFIKSGPPNGSGLPRWARFTQQHKCPMILAETIGM